VDQEDHLYKVLVGLEDLLGKVLEDLVAYQEVDLVLLDKDQVDPKQIRE
jgi:hypothetical protein